MNDTDSFFDFPKWLESLLEGIIIGMPSKTAK